jgi:hypothetical protein
MRVALCLWVYVSDLRYHGPVIGSQRDDRIALRLRLTPSLRYHGEAEAARPERVCPQALRLTSSSIVRPSDVNDAMS